MPRILAAVALLLFASMASAQPYVKSNGIFRVQLAGYSSPIITSLSLYGVQVVPHDNIGADMQMTARSPLGDAYNPTQGGDCRGIPSLLSGVIPNWTGAGLGTPSSYGILLGISPRNYNEPSYPGCLGPGAILPYSFAFGLTLGDGVAMPRNLMVMDMSLRRLSGSQQIIKAASELPVAFVDNNNLRYAYISNDASPLDGVTFVRMNVNTGSRITHDSKAWPLVTNYIATGHALMLCNRADAIENPRIGTCMAFYVHEPTRIYASHRHGAIYDLTLMSALGDNPATPYVADYNWHTARRVVVAGTPYLVSQSIEWAERNLPAWSWARW